MQVAKMIPFQTAYGRKPHDPSRLAAVPPHIMAAEASAPATLPRPELVWTPTLCENDVLPTCVVAALANSARLWALVRGQWDPIIAEPSLLAFYAAVCPCGDDVASIAQTDGLQVLDVLE